MPDFDRAPRPICAIDPRQAFTDVSVPDGSSQAEDYAMNTDTAVEYCQEVTKLDTEGGTILRQQGTGARRRADLAHSRARLKRRGRSGLSADRRPTSGKDGGP